MKWKKNRNRLMIGLVALAAILLFHCQQVSATSSLIASGTFGTDNALSWTLDEAGTLRISGNGEIPTGTSPWTDYKDQVLALIIEPGVTGGIPENMCNRHSNLTSVVIPEGITSVGKYAFRRCTNLKEITFPDSIIDISNGIFLECTSLEHFAFSSGVTYIPNQMFLGCTALKDVMIPDGVTAIYPSAFSRCVSLTYINLPVSLTSIKGSAFTGSGLIQIDIPAGVTEIGEQAFWNCTNLRTVNISEGISIIENRTFLNCTNLTTVNIPKGVTIIDNQAFVNCVNLKTIAIPDTVTELGDEVFSVNALTELVIPASVTQIGTKVFEHCENLTSIHFLGDAPDIKDCIFLFVTATAYYPADNETWTEEMRQNYGGNITWVPYETGAPAVEITVNNVGAAASGAVLSPPEGGWKEGTNTFTVSCPNPCVVAVSYDGGLSYIRLTATVLGDAYSFTAEAMTDNTILAVARSGDLDGNGKLTNLDAARCRAGFLGYLELNALQRIIVDANGDGKITNLDAARLRSAFLGKYELKW